MIRLPRGCKAQVLGTRYLQTVYTAEQVRAFAAKAVAAERENRKPLTDEAIDHIFTGVLAVHNDIDAMTFARAIEAAHNIKEQP